MMSASLEVFGVGTARTFRVHWMLQEIGVAHSVHPLQSRSGETQGEAFLALNPRGKIPLLRHGELVLAESAAIVGYLAEHFSGDERRIPPPASRERALYDQWAFWILTELDAHTLYILRRHGDLANLYGEAPAALRAAREYFQRQVEVADAALARGDGFLLGSHLTGVDVLLGSCLDWARFYGETLSETLEAYRLRLAGRSAYQRAVDVNFPPEVRAALAASRNA
ncbi:MAG: glutathione S-transferase family protein [bacterium]|nr:glutathione S-transferase family protein [bacterium]